MAGKIYRMDLPRAGWQARRWRFAAMDADAPWPGAVSLTVLDELARPFYAGPREHRRRVVDSGFYWVQLAPAGERWWLTAMFDEHRRLVQFYFDVTLENRILPGGGSWCRDAWADVILEPDGETRVVDLDELEAAAGAGELTQADADRVRSDAYTLAEQFRGRAAELETLCRSWMEELLRKIEGGREDPDRGQ